MLEALNLDVLLPLNYATIEYALYVLIMGMSSFYFKIICCGYLSFTIHSPRSQFAAV